MNWQSICMPSGFGFNFWSNFLQGPVFEFCNLQKPKSKCRHLIMLPKALALPGVVPTFVNKAPNGIRLLMNTYMLNTRLRPPHTWCAFWIWF